MGRIFKPTRPLLDAHGQPVLDADGTPKRVPRTNKWYVRVYDANGKARDIATGTSKITKAKQMMADLESAKGKGEDIAALAGRITYDDAVQMVIDDQEVNKRRAVDDVKQRIELHLKPAFTGKRMTAITADVVMTYIKARQEAGAANATINRETGILKRAFTLALRAKKLASAPYIPKLEESDPQTGFFERAEFETVRDHLPAHLHNLATFYYLTGWRSNEALTLEIRQVDVEQGTMTLDPSQTKNKRGRVVNFSQWTALGDLLKAQLASAKRLQQEASIITHVFHNPDGTPIKSFRRPWVAARKAAGFPAKKVHDFRRTAVRNLVRAGVPETVAMKITGHRTRSVFDRYNITSPEDLKQAGALMEAFDAAGKQDGKPAGRVRQFRKRA